MIGRRVGFDDFGSKQIFAEQIAVMVVEAGNGNVKPGPRKASVSQLVTVELFRPERWICTEACEDRQPV